MSLLKQIIADLKDEPAGATLKEKNKYRLTIAIIMVGLAVASAFLHPLISLIPLAVAARKFHLVFTDKK